MYTSLALRAIQTPDAVLVALECFGFLTVLAILIWIPGRPGLTMPFVSLAMFGLWGVAEHVQRDPGKSTHRATGALLTILQFALVVGGSAAAALAIYAAVGFAIGTIVS